MEMSTIRPVSFLVSEGFSLLALTSSIAVLNAANKILEARTYEWRLVSEPGGDVVSECGISLSTVCLDALPPSKRGRNHLLALIVGSLDGPTTASKASAWIRKCSALGAQIAGIGQGVLWLAQAGLLEGKHCAVHRDFFPAATERFPNVLISLAYHCSDGHIHTCAGEAAAFDFFLSIVASDFGEALSERINDRVLHGEPRGNADRQQLMSSRRLQRINSPLVPIMVHMERNIAEPISMKNLSRIGSLSRRQIERLFSKHLGETPRKHLLRIRMERARSLLAHTAIPIVEVAVAVGHKSHSHFARVYKDFYGLTPMETRRTAAADTRPRAFVRSENSTLAA